MDLEFVVDIFAAILGYAFFFWFFSSVFTNNKKQFFNWLIHNKWYHVISLSPALLNIILVSFQDFEIDFILFSPIILLTYYFIVFFGFIIYWNIKKMGSVQERTKKKKDRIGYFNWVFGDKRKIKYTILLFMLFVILSFFMKSTFEGLLILSIMYFIGVFLFLSIIYFLYYVLAE